MTNSLVGGVPGVGKSTIVRAVSAMLGVPVFNIGTAIFEKARNQGLVQNRDELRTMRRELLDHLRWETVTHIGAARRSLIDSQILLLTERGFQPALSSQLIREMGVSQIVLIEAEEAAILNRRRSEAVRFRNSESEASVRLHQQLNRAYAIGLGVKSGLPVAIVFNPQEKSPDAVIEVARVVSGTD